MNTELKLKPYLLSSHLYCPTVIVSSGIFLPQQVVKSEDLLEEIHSFSQYGVESTWMSDVLGICERRFADCSETPASMAIKAAKQALASTNVALDRIDKIIFCGIDKNQPEPATAHTVNHELGLKAKEVSDITDACFGFMRGIEDCVRAITLGDIDHALVVTGELPSRVVRQFISRMKSGVDKKTAEQWMGFLTAGDAGGALLLGPGDIGSSIGFGKLTTRVNSNLSDKCFYKIKSNGEIHGQMKMGHLTAHGMRMYKSIADEITSDPDWVEPDHIISHGTGKGSFNALSKLKSISRGKCFKTFHKLGNITSATFPVNFHLLNESTKLQSGDRLACYFNGSGLVVGHRTYTM